jgi:hypothetical protein
VYPNGRPADFRFHGIRKLAKATGRSADKVLHIMMRAVSLDGLNVETEVKGTLIDINRKSKPKAGATSKTGSASAGKKAAVKKKAAKKAAKKSAKTGAKDAKSPKKAKKKVVKAKTKTAKAKPKSADKGTSK